MKATGYSLWLMPDKDTDAYRFMQSLIEDLARIAGGPVFAPHVTLLGGMEGPAEEMLAKTKKLAGQVSPFDISLGKSGTQRVYFRGFFAEVRQDAAVMAAGAEARRVFSMPGDYFPHESLSYWDYSEEVLAKLQKATANTDFSRGNFTAHSVHLYRTEGVVAEWEFLKEFSFLDAH